MTDWTRPVSRGFVLATLVALALVLQIKPAVAQDPDVCGSTAQCKGPETGQTSYTYIDSTWHGGPFTSESAAIADFEANTNAAFAACSNSIHNPAWLPKPSGLWVGTVNNPDPLCGPADCYTTTVYLGVEKSQRKWTLRNDMVVANNGTTTPACSVNVTTGSVQFIRGVPIGCPEGFSENIWTAPPISYCYRSKDSPPPQKNLGGCKDCDAMVGNPVNTATGNKFQVERDYRGSGDFPLEFTRYYNFFARFSWRIPDAGPNYYIATPNWRNTYDRSVIFTDHPVYPVARAYREDGKVLDFNLVAGAFVPDADIDERLTRLVDGLGNTTGWSLKNARDETELYDATGRLQSITNRGGISQTLAYDSAGMLLTVTHSFGQQLSFTYDVNNHLESVTLPNGGVITYTYGWYSNLTSATYPDTRVRTYHYEYWERGLTGITDESSNRFATYTYDLQGRVTSSEHAGGAEKFTFTYDSPTQTTVTDALNTSRTYGHTAILGSVRGTGVSSPCTACGSPAKAKTFDANGNVASRKNFNDQLTCYAYDSARNLQTVRVEGFASSVTSCPSNLASYTPAPGTRERKIVTTWHSTFRLPTSITEANRKTSFTHDSNGNVLTRTLTDTSVTPNVSRTWTYTYNTYGQVLTADGPRTDVNDVTTYTYYSCTTGAQCGQINTVTNALGHLTTYNSYNAHGQPTQITDPNGLVTSMGYDARQRMTDRCVGGALPSCSGGELTHLEYWPTGLLKKVTSPDGSYIQYTYDAAHRLTQVNDGAGNQVVYTLDNMGNRTAENTYDPSNALRRTHSRVFNNLNQLWKDVNAAGTAAVTTTFGYDSQGNQSSVAAPLSRNSSSLYDELNRLQQITDPASGVTQFAYDANDNLASVTDPRSLVTSYTYNGFGDLKTQASPDTGVTTNTYDSGGNLDTSTDARGAVTDYAYDAANRVTSAAFILGGTSDPTITYTYDAGTYGKGRLTGASDSNHALAWTYDAHGRVTGKSQTVGSVVLAEGYAFNASGQLATITLPSGNTVGFGYNSNNQVTSVTLNGSTTISAVTYDPFGPITGWTWGNATTASRAFDTDGKLTQLDNANGTSLKNLAYDDAFRITGITDVGNSAYSWSYGYDNLDRLTSATGSSITRGWTYDANGNRLTETGSAPSSFTYTTSPGSNRLASITGSLPRTYGYDAAGNTLSYASASLSYNARGRLASATNSGTAASYVYNALGRRVKRTVSGAATLYAYDEAGHLQGEYNSTGALIQETVWLGDIPIATIRPNGSSGVDLFYVHADQLNTPRLVTDTANNLRWSWESDPFGTNAPDENPSSLGLFKYNLRFPGQQFDGVLGLHYNYFRDYDPAVGGYAQSDPIGLSGGWSTYAYVSGNPVSFVDANGLMGAGHGPSGPYRRDNRMIQPLSPNVKGCICQYMKQADYQAYLAWYYALQARKNGTWNDPILRPCENYLYAFSAIVDYGDSPTIIGLGVDYHYLTKPSDDGGGGGGGGGGTTPSSREARDAGMKGVGDAKSGKNWKQECEGCNAGSK